MLVLLDRAHTDMLKDSCKNEHPGSQRDSNRGFGGRGGGFGGGSNNNRFGAFAGDSYRPGQQSGGAFGTS